MTALLLAALWQVAPVNGAPGLLRVYREAGVHVYTDDDVVLSTNSKSC